MLGLDVDPALSSLSPCCADPVPSIVPVLVEVVLPPVGLTSGNVLVDSEPVATTAITVVPGFPETVVLMVETILPVVQLPHVPVWVHVPVNPFAVAQVDQELQHGPLPLPHGPQPLIPPRKPLGHGPPGVPHRPPFQPLGGPDMALEIPETKGPQVPVQVTASPDLGENVASGAAVIDVPALTHICATAE